MQTFHTFQQHFWALWSYKLCILWQHFLPERDIKTNEYEDWRNMLMATDKITDNLKQTTQAWYSFWHCVIILAVKIRLMVHQSEFSNALRKFDMHATRLSIYDTSGVCFYAYKEKLRFCVLKLLQRLVLIGESYNNARQITVSWFSKTKWAAEKSICVMICSSAHGLYEQQLTATRLALLTMLNWFLRIFTRSVIFQLIYYLNSN